MNRTQYAVLAAPLLLTTSAIAHQNNELKQTELIVKTALVARAGGMPSQPVLVMPGFMLGGESFSAERGIRFDDIQLLGTKNFDDRYFVSAKIGGHQHGSDSELTVENLWFGTKVWGEKLTLEVGKMATAVTPTANYHTAQDSFTEAPLLADVYFGRHHYDNGARATLDIANAQLGIEYYSGDSWPVDGLGDDGALALFLGYQLQFGAHQIVARIWGLGGDVDSRSDARLSSDHHAEGDVTTELTPFDFTGEVKLAGALMTYQYQSSNWLLKTEFEVISANQQGVLNEGSQFGAIDNQTEGYRLKQSFTHQQHQVNLQYEYLVADNTFTDTSSLMVESLGLYNDGFEPTRLLLNWRWQFTPDLTLVTEYNQEQLTPENEQQRFALGLLWNWHIL